MRCLESEIFDLAPMHQELIEFYGSLQHTNSIKQIIDIWDLSKDPHRITEDGCYKSWITPLHIKKGIFEAKISIARAGGDRYTADWYWGIDSDTLQSESKFTSPTIFGEDIFYTPERGLYFALNKLIGKFSDYGQTFPSFSDGRLEALHFCDYLYALIDDDELLSMVDNAIEEKLDAQSSASSPVLLV